MIRSSLRRHRAGFAIALGALLLLGVARPLRADFNDIANAIEARYSVHRTWIPFFGLARIALHVAHPNGVRDVQLATFEKRDFGSLDELAALVRSNAGNGFTRIVQSSERNGHWTVILARPDGGNLVDLLILTHDASDTTLVQVTVDADKFATAVKNPHSFGR